MKKGKTHRIKFRRKREGKTDYRKRLKLLLGGTPRLVVRKSLNNIYAQIIEYGEEGDKAVLAASSSMLGKYGWKINKGNIPAAYLTGLLMGKKAKSKGINELVLDSGLSPSVKGSRVYALLKGVVDAGLNVPHLKDILPGEERITGGHITKYAEALKKGKGDYEKKFSSYIKNKVSPEEIKKLVEETKKKIVVENG